MHPEEFPILRILDLTTGEANLALSSTPDGFDLQSCYWANNERLLCEFAAITGGWTLYGITRLVAVNADGSQMTVLLERKRQFQFAQFQGRIVDWLVDDPKRVLVVVPHDKGATLNPLDIYSGRIGAPIDKQFGSVDWMSDGRGSPRLYLYASEDQVRWKYRRSGQSKWRVLHKKTASYSEDDYRPIGFGDDPDRLLVLKPHEGRLALWAVDLKREKWRRVARKIRANRRDWIFDRSTAPAFLRRSRGEDFREAGFALLRKICQRDR
jgi:hypothetical protein